MNISNTQLPGLFTQGVQETYTDALSPKLAFKGMVSETKESTKLVSIAVQRRNEKIAVDVIRGTNGNRNQITRSNVKVFETPFFHEYIDITTLENYNRVFGESTVSDTMVADLVSEAMVEAAAVVDKINRRYELQWSQVFETGIVQLVNGENIDFKRKAESIVDVSVSGGGYWSAGAATIKEDLTEGCEFLRTVGKSNVAVMNAYMGEGALNAFLSATQTLAEGDTRWIKRMSIEMPSRTPNGMAFHGQYSAGSWVVNVFTYPDYYDLSGVSTPFIPTNKVFLVPSEGFRFTHKYAATPTVFEVGNAAAPLGGRVIGNRTGDFNMYTSLDDRKFTHVLGIMSAGLAVPLSVDQIYTMTVLA